MKIVDVIDRNTGLLEELTALWRQSVAQTHTFLTGKDIDEIENYVPQALKEVEHLVVAQNNGDYLGFMGIEKHRLEMLFLAPQCMGQGVGRKLIEYGKYDDLMYDKSSELYKRVKSVKIKRTQNKNN